MADTRAALLLAGLETFDELGFGRATVSAIRAAAGASNGSFFHFFGSKEALAAALYLDAIRAYHRAMLAPLAVNPGAADGIAALIEAHMAWVVNNRREARFLFEHSSAKWLDHIREEQRDENESYRSVFDNWREPLVESGDLRPMPPPIFYSQLIGPAQMVCRAWLSGREETDPREQIRLLIDNARRALVGKAEAPVKKRISGQ